LSLLALQARESVAPEKKGDQKMPGITVKIELLRGTIIASAEGRVEGQIGDVFELSKQQAATLVFDGAAKYLEPHRAPTAVTTMEADHGDPMPRKISSGPPRVTAKKDAEI
jgi:hypothetical protein